jgi:hypothetical protein
VIHPPFVASPSKVLHCPPLSPQLHLRRLRPLLPTGPRSRRRSNCTTLFCNPHSFTTLPAAPRIFTCSLVVDPARSVQSTAPRTVRTPHQHLARRYNTVDTPRCGHASPGTAPLPPTEPFSVPTDPLWDPLPEVEISVATILCPLSVSRTVAQTQQRTPLTIRLALSPSPCPAPKSPMPSPSHRARPLGPASPASSRPRLCLCGIGRPRARLGGVHCPPVFYR